MKPAEQFRQWQRPWWVGPKPMVLAWLCIVAYGSLVPFDLNVAGYVTSHDDWGALAALLTSPRWIAGATEVSALGISTWTSDLTLNLLLYVPLGVLLRLAVHKPRRSWLTEVLVASSIVAGSSWLLECAQTLSPTRYASLGDFFANTIPGVGGVLLGVLLRDAHRRIIFWVFRKVARPLLYTYAWLRMLRQHPLAMFALVAVNVAIIGGWYVMTKTTILPPAEHSAMNLMPFEQHFERSYDVAAVWLGRSLLVYVLIGGLLALTMVRPRARRNLGWLVLLMTLLAAGVEVVRYYVGNTRADITEPIIAACAVGLIFTTLFLLIHAVRCSCRRQEQMQVEVDRRRQTHDYRFAISHHPNHQPR